MIQSKETTYKVKQSTNQLEDVTMAATMTLCRRKNFQKQKTNSNNEYYNCH